MALPEIKIPITADADGVKVGVSSAIRQLERLDGLSDRIARGFQVSGDKLTKWGKNLSYVSAGIAAAATAAFAMTKNAADMGDRIANASKAAGVGSEYFQEMAFAVGQVADVTEEEFGDSLVKLTKRLGEAKEGSKSAIAAFEAIGISQEQIASGSIGTEEAMNAFVAKMATVTDEATAAAMASDLFGKSGARMGGLLAGSAGEIAGLRDRARELGIVMSAEGVAASEKFGDKWEEVGRSFGALQVQIADALLPVLVDTLIPALTEKVIPALGEVASWVGDLVRWFGDLPAPVQEAAAVVAGAFAVGGPVLLALGATASAIGAMVAATGPIGLLIGAAALLGAAWVQWGDDFMAAVGGAVEWVSAKFDAFVTKLKEVVEWAKEVGREVAKALAIGRDEMNSGSGYGGMGGAMGGEAEMFGGGGGGSQSTGAALGDGLAQGVLDSMAAHTPALQSAFQGVTDLARETWDVHSPSRVFAEIGQNIGQGLAQGIQDTGWMTTEALQGISTAASGITSGMVSDVLGSLGQLFEGNKAFAAGQALVNMWQGATEALKLPFPANLVAFSKTLATGAVALRNIKAAQPGGGGASGGGAASGGAGAAAALPAANITLVGDTFRRSTIEDLFGQINDGLRQGRTINLVRS